MDACTSLIVLPWYKPEVGGVVHGVSQLVNGSPLAGVKVTILLQQPLAEPTRLAPMVTFRSLPLTPACRWWEGHRIKSLVAFLFYLLPTAHRLRPLPREQQVDLVNVHYPSGQYMYFGMLRRWFGYPLVVSVHGSDIRYQYDIGGINQRAYKYLLLKSDAITAVSDDLSDQVRNRVSLQDDKVLMTVFGGADREFLKSETSRPSKATTLPALCGTASPGEGTRRALAGIQDCHRAGSDRLSLVPRRRWRA